MCNEMRFCLHLYKHKLSLLGLRAKASIRNAYLSSINCAYIARYLVNIRLNCTLFYST